MPTQNPVPPMQGTPDDIAVLYSEALRQREVLRKRWSARGPSPQEVAGELEGTVLSLMIKFMRATGANIHAIHGGLQEFHDRLSDLEGDLTQFTPEDAEKFLALCGVVADLVAIVRERSGLPSELQKKLAEAEALAGECATIIHESTLVDAEDDEDEDEPSRGREVAPEDDDEDARAERGE